MLLPNVWFSVFQRAHAITLEIMERQRKEPPIIRTPRAVPLVCGEFPVVILEKRIVIFREEVEIEEGSLKSVKIVNGILNRINS